MLRLQLALIVAASACSVPERHFTTGDGGPPGDGTAGDPAVPGAYRWVRSVSNMYPNGIAEGTAGVEVSGYFSAPVDLGSGTVLPVGSTDMVLASYASADASYQYAFHYGNANGTAYGGAVADLQGIPFVLGVSYGLMIDLGLGPVTGGGGAGADGFIGRYGPATPAWVQRLVGTGEDKILASALSPNASLYAAGFFEGNTTWNGATIMGSGYRDVFLTQLNSFTGTSSLTRHYGGAGRDEASGIAATNTNLFLSGFFDDTISFGGSTLPLTATLTAAMAPSLDCFVAKLDSNGDGVWAKQFGGAGVDRDPRVAIDSAGDVYIGGAFTDTVAFGATTLTAVGAADMFVAKLNGSDGTVVWAVSLGSTTDDSVSSIAVDQAGHVMISGAVTGPIDGGTSAGDFDGILASFEATTGAPRWRHVYSGPGRDTTATATYGIDGDVYAVLSMSALLDFGVPIVGPSNPVGVVLRIAP
jgi:hypothetical protein